MYTYTLLYIKSMSTHIHDCTVHYQACVYMYMCIYTNTHTPDKVLGIVMMVVSVVIVLPVAGPVALITFFVLKKTGHDKKAG